MVSPRLPLLLLVFMWAASCRDAGEREERRPPLATQTSAASDAAPASPPIPRFASREGGEDEEAALDREGALPAWQAVIRRHRLLARRGAEGRVYGRFALRAGAPWLVDETEGEGALAIRLDLSALGTAPPEPGARYLLRGAWTAGEGRWLFRAAEIWRLAPAKEELPAGFPLEVRRVAALPDGAVPVSEAEGAGTLLFAVLEPPLRPGDGWLIADAPGEDPAARLLLPGERRPYGGQALFADDERWELEVGARYAVRVRRFRRPRREGAIPLMRAEAAPVALDGPARPARPAVQR